MVLLGSLRASVSTEWVLASCAIQNRVGAAGRGAAHVCSMSEAHLLTG